MNKRIFTFWEPKEKMPGYIQLCLKTWQKFLPSYEIVVLDYNTLKDYLTSSEIHEFLYKKFPLQQQADALRTIVLAKYGGIWLDADTILTSSYIFQENKKSPCVMIGNEKDLHLAFVYALKDSIFIQKWVEAVRERVAEYRNFSHLLFLKKLFKEKRRRLKNWDYLGNAIIDPLRQSLPAKELLVVDKDDIGVFPERIYSISESLPEKQYKDFYFTPSNISLDEALSKTKGIILLHNSWTPKEYKDMGISEFLNQDILLTHLLKKVLGIK